MRRRTLISIAVIVLILAAGWSGAWFWLAGWADRKAGEQLEELARQGLDIDCQQRTVIGFPFALRVTCAETRVAETVTDTRADVAGVSGGASLLAPMTVNINLTSPVRVDSAQFTAPAEMNWEDAALNVGMGMNGPRDVTFATAGLEANVSIPDVPVQKIAAESAQGALSPSSDGGTDVAVAFAGLRLFLGAVELPPVTGVAAGVLSVPPRALLAGRAGVAAPVTAKNINIALESNGARFRAQGQIAVDADGLIDGVITFQIAGADALPTFIAALPEAWQKIGNLVAGGLFAFGKPTSLDGEPASELTLEIEQGEARIGPIEFGLPRVPI